MLELVADGLFTNMFIECKRMDIPELVVLQVRTAALESTVAVVVCPLCPFIVLPSERNIVIIRYRNIHVSLDRLTGYL